MIEFWRAGGPNTAATAEAARAVEEAGWQGQMFMDSQSLSADPYAQMGAWALATSTIQLSTGVTNPFTRNLAVTAAGAATIQSISSGRAVLGIGRGDSALAYLGLAPVGLGHFERSLQSLQALLRGEEAAFDAISDVSTGGAPLDSLTLGARPEGVALKWLPKDLPKVPFDVAATGPKVIAMGARLAERVTFSIGAEVERANWALGIARDARKQAGLGGDGISYGVQIVVSCHPDPDTGMEAAMTMAPPSVRFQVLHGHAAGLQNAADTETLEAVRTGYDMTRHGVVGAKDRLVEGGLDPDFVRRFAIVGSPDHCIERLLALKAAGIERFVIIGPGFYPDSWGDARDLFAREVIPAVRGGT